MKVLAAAGLAIVLIAGCGSKESPAAMLHNATYACNLAEVKRM
jgi:hypothetical protein